ncbi:MAG: UDP-N-acetylmuramoyl-L-alanyl-D-glutamate--2,6-diaminopimelate ligase [Bacillota bacterium]|nr:UDP-N-acetylmuramoyl-L-alanyl-D-glutamate--2,6-diaminopimelate ligase [Bacillota bacterium]
MTGYDTGQLQDWLLASCREDYRRDDFLLERCSGITADSRRVRPGMLFAAIRGLTVDGHRFLPEVARKGAAAALVEVLDPTLSLPQFVVPDTPAALGTACRTFYATAPQGLRYVAVTGTNGKTTTTRLAAHMLGALGLRVGSVSTNGISHPLLESGHLDHTTPDTVSLHQLLARLIELGSDIILIETSSHALVQQRVAGIRFDVGAFTNLSHEHLDYHGTMADYGAAKALLFAGLSPDARAVLNRDDAAYSQMAFVCEAPIHDCSLTDTDARIHLLPDTRRLTDDGQSFAVNIDGHTFSMELPLPGVYNIANCLVALGIVAALGEDIQKAAAAASSFPGAEGRMERIRGPVPCRCYIDFAHTTAALEASLGALRETLEPGGRLHVLLSVRGEREREKRADMGLVASRLADRVVLTLKDTGHEPPGQILADIAAGFTGPAAIEVEPNRPRALRRLVMAAGPDDVIMVLGLVGRDRLTLGDRRLLLDDAAALRLAGAELEMDRYLDAGS